MAAAAASLGAGSPRPVSVYVSWAAHDELSDTVPLDERLANHELDAIRRLQAHGAQFDYFLLDMGWFDKDGGFRTFQRQRWPNGPEGFFAACRRQGIRPGLWLSTNVCGWSANPWLSLKPEWSDSRGGYLGEAMSLHTGSFLAYQIGTMERWYDRGVRLFKFDFANFGAASPAELARLGAKEVERLNIDSWREALVGFRARHPDVVLIAYNGYGGETSTTYPGFSKSIDLRWLDAFDALYCGDPKPSDVPCENLWRSLDVYSDAMVFQYRANGVPLSRIDSSGFMFGRTGTCYRRGKAAWKGMLVLSAARGNRINTYYGDIAQLDDADAVWFAKVQGLYYALQERGEVGTFGAYPGAGKPYGFVARDAEGVVCTVVNPGSTAADIVLPVPAGARGRVLFSDAGYAPELEPSALRLGPGELAVVGFGTYADPEWSLGIQDDVVIASSSEPVAVRDLVSGPRSASCEVIAPAGKTLQIVCSQTDPKGRPWRVTGGAPPSGISLGKMLVVSAEQDGRAVRLSLPYDRQIWSGLSWAVAEVAPGDMTPGHPIRISYSVNGGKKVPVVVSISAFAVDHAPAVAR